ncbi:hypothetical protein BH11MYX3_BH11MYX3_36940 [soil metagenome]
MDAVWADVPKAFEVRSPSGVGTRERHIRTSRTPTSA